MKRALALLALVALAACDDKKPVPAPTPLPSTTPSAVTVTPSATVSASAAALPPPPAVDDAALLALHGKYEAPAKELAGAVKTAIAEERKKQADGGAKQFSRVPLPASKLSKDASVLQIAVANPNDLYVSVQPFNALPRTGSGNAAKVPKAGDAKVRCPSEYTNEPAADLLYTDGPSLVVTVKTDACKAINAQRDAEIERVKKIVDPIQKAIVAHAGKVPAKCEAPKEVEPEVSPELKAAGITKARLTCRNANESSWQAHGARDRKYDRKNSVVQPALRPTVAGFTQPAFFLTDDLEKGKPFQLTFIGTRADKVEVEVEVEFYLE